MPSTILIAEDYQKYCQFIFSVLRQRAEYEIVGQASDGFEAIHMARQLKPDLILLDVGLPKLSGLEAAEQILDVDPHAKIVFLSRESSSEIVQEALRLGAVGYVVKDRGQNTLLPAIDGALASKRSGAQQLTAHGTAKISTVRLPRAHEVLFYSGESIFIEGATGFIVNALKAGGPVIAIVTKSHQECLARSLQLRGLNIESETQKGSFIRLDAGGILSAVMINGSLDSVRFREDLRGLIESACNLAGMPRPRVAIFGEAATLLWEGGKSAAALQLENAANGLSDAYETNILCAYPIRVCQAGPAFRGVCTEHSAFSIR